MKRSKSIVPIFSSLVYSFAVVIFNIFSTEVNVFLSLKLHSKKRYLEEYLLFKNYFGKYILLETLGSYTKKTRDCEWSVYKFEGASGWTIVLRWREVRKSKRRKIAVDFYNMDTRNPILQSLKFIKLMGGYVEI